MSIKETNLLSLHAMLAEQAAAERNRQVTAIADERLLLKTLMQSLPDLVWLKDVDGTYLLCNRAFERFFGASEAEIIGKTDADFVDAELAALFRSNDLAAMKADTPCVNEEWVTFADDGQRHLLETTKLPLRDTDGRTTGVLGIAHDITRRKQMESELASQADFQKTLLNAMNDVGLQLMVVENGKIIHTGNRELARQFGFTDVDLDAHPDLIDIVHPEDKARVMDYHRRRILGEAVPGSYELGLVTHDGKRREYETAVAVVPGTHPLRIVTVGKDITERKRMEMALAESRQFLNQIIDTIPDPVFVKDREHRWIHLNQAFCEFLGHPLETLLGKSDYDFFPMHEAEVFWAKDEAVFESGEENVNEENFTDRDGNTHTIVTKKVCYTDDRGQAFLVGIIMDITARKQAEEALRESEEKLRDLFMLSPLGIALTDMNGRYLEFNEAFRAICGYPADELKTLDYWALTPHEYASKEAEQLEFLSRTGRYGPYEKAYRNKDGKLIPIQLNGTLVTGKDGEKYIWSIVEDISERRQAEMLLSRREEEFRALAENLPDPIFRYDRHCRRIYINPAVERTFGKKIDGLLGEMPNDGAFVPVHEGEKLVDFIRWVAETGQPVEHEIEVMGPDGAIHYFQNRYVPEWGSDGEVASVLSIAREFTGRKLLEMELLDHRDHLQQLVAEQTGDLLQAKQAAEAASRAKSMFLANMSHELRTPLHGILLFSELGLEKFAESSPERLEKYFTSIRDSGIRLLNLVNDLLDLSKLEAGKVVLDLQPICLASLTQEVATEFELMLAERSLTFVLHPSTCDTVLLVDKQRMGQVLRNVLSNAFKFSPTGGTIAVRIDDATLPPGRRSDDKAILPMLCLTVADAGPGIPEGELEQVFDEFVQSSRTRTGAGGTGLGLPICRRIVTAHQGRISARNRPQGGAELELQLPKLKLPLKPHLGNT